jgi:hypothetical protein
VWPSHLVSAVEVSSSMQRQDVHGPSEVLVHLAAEDYADGNERHREHGADWELLDTKQREVPNEHHHHAHVDLVKDLHRHSAPSAAAHMKVSPMRR